MMTLVGILLGAALCVAMGVLAGRPSREATRQLDAAVRKMIEEGTNLDVSGYLPMDLLLLESRIHMNGGRSYRSGWHLHIERAMS